MKESPREKVRRIASGIERQGDDAPKHSEEAKSHYRKATRLKLYAAGNAYRSADERHKAGK